MAEQLATTEAARLAELEETIDRGLQTFVEVGQALLEIRESRLYRADFDRFEHYCRKRCGLDRSYAYRHIQAAAPLSVLQLHPSSGRGVRADDPLAGCGLDL